MNSKFKILYLIFLSVISLSSLLFAGAPDTLWTRTYGDTASERGYLVQQVSDGGFIIAGSKSTLQFGYVYLIRINSNGDTLWTKTYTGSLSDFGESVIQISDGGFVMIGRKYNPITEGSDVYLIRTNINGDSLWAKTYGGDTTDEGNSVQQTADGGFVIVGVTASFGEGQEDVYLIRTDSNGDTLWTKTYGGTKNDIGYSVQELSDSGFIITGYTGSFNPSGVYLIRTNSYGDTLWTKTYGGSSGHAVKKYADGFIIAGVFYSDSNEYDIYLIRTDFNGDTIWTKTFGGKGWDFGESVQVINDSEFIIAGFTESFGAGLSDFYLIKSDFNGDTLWTKTFGGSDEDWCYSVDLTNDGGYIVVGTTASFGSGRMDVYLIRLDKDTTEIQNDNPFYFLKTNNLIVSYNNRSILIFYTLPYSTSVKLEVYDIKGKLVKVITDKFMNKGSYSISWDNKRFGSGVFFIKFSINGSAVSKRIVVVK